MRLSFHVPVGDLGILLIFGIAASVLASAATGRIVSRARVGALLAAGAVLTALALAAEALAPRLWLFAGGMVLFGAGFGVIDTALNAYAARHFGARDINFMHASYGLGAIIGPLLATAFLAWGLGWRRTFGVLAVIQAAVACVLALTHRAWRPAADPAAKPPPGRDKCPAAHSRPRAAALSALAFAAVETGIESGAGIWGYLSA